MLLFQAWTLITLCLYCLVQRREKDKNQAEQANSTYLHIFICLTNGNKATSLSKHIRIDVVAWRKMAVQSESTLHSITATCLRLQKQNHNSKLKP